MLFEPLSKVVNLFLSDAFTFLDLVVDNKLGVLVEDRVLSTCEWCVLFENILRVDFRRNNVEQTVRFLDDLTNVDGVAMVVEILENDIPRLKLSLRVAE